MGIISNDDDIFSNSADEGTSTNENEVGISFETKQLRITRKHKRSERRKVLPSILICIISFTFYFKERAQVINASHTDVKKNKQRIHKICTTTTQKIVHRKRLLPPRLSILVHLLHWLPLVCQVQEC